MNLKFLSLVLVVLTALIAGCSSQQPVPSYIDEVNQHRKNAREFSNAFHQEEPLYPFVRAQTMHALSKVSDVHYRFIDEYVAKDQSCSNIDSKKLATEYIANYSTSNTTLRLFTRVTYNKLSDDLIFLRYNKHKSKRTKMMKREPEYYPSRIAAFVYVLRNPEFILPGQWCRMFNRGLAPYYEQVQQLKSSQQINKKSAEYLRSIIGSSAVRKNAVISARLNESIGLVFFKFVDPPGFNDELSELYFFTGANGLKYRASCASEVIQGNVWGVEENSLWKDDDVLFLSGGFAIKSFKKQAFNMNAKLARGKFVSCSVPLYLLQDSIKAL